MRIPISAYPRARFRGATLVLLGLLASCATESPQNTHFAADLPAAASPPPSPAAPVSPTPGPLVALAIAPVQLTVLTASSPVPFTATGKDARGQDVALPVAATWSVTPGTGTATIDAQGQFAPGNAGTVTVNAAGGGLTAAVPVTIISTPFTSIAIVLPSPSPTPTPTPTPTPAASPTPTPTPAASVVTALTVNAGSVTPLAATATDANGTTAAVTPTWTVSPAPNAYVDDQGNLRAFLSGNITLTARVPSTSSQAIIAVAPGPALAIFVSGAAGTIGVGTPVQLAASGRDQFNNVVPLPDLQWSIVAGGVGRATIAGNGLLSPSSPGDITVLAQAGSLSATLALRLQVPILTEITPFSGRVGDIITVSGSGFGSTPGGGASVSSCTGAAGSTTPGPNPSATPLAAGVNTVYFSDGRNPTVPANEIVCWSDVQAQVKVPDGARPGPLAVRIGAFVSNTVAFVRLFGITAP